MYNSVYITTYFCILGEKHFSVCMFLQVRKNGMFYHFLPFVYSTTLTSECVFLLHWCLIYEGHMFDNDILGYFNIRTSHALCVVFIQEIVFLHAKSWIPGGEKSIFTVVIHSWRSPFRQFARARTIDEYDVTMPVSSVRATSQINCSDVTMLNQKRRSLATMAKSAIDDCFQRNCAFRDIN